MQKSSTWRDFIISMSRVTKEKTMNYGKVIDSLSKKWHEWNTELFFYQGIMEQAKERDNRIAINPWLIVFCLARWLAASLLIAMLQKPHKNSSEPPYKVII